MAQKIITGIKPTGIVHLGNYFGTIKQMEELQSEGDLYVFIADLHALTSLSDDEALHSAEQFCARTYHVLSALIALGIDPKRTILYRQSDFPQITEIMWLFTCLLRHQFLATGHAFKDAQAQSKAVGLGTFMYPVLMAADILSLNIDCVPVGKDQAQHIEIAREIARKCNTKLGVDYFKEPQERILEDVAVIPGTDGEKMSKSRGNVIPLFSDEATIKQSIMRITTDSTPAGAPLPLASTTIGKYLALLLPEEHYRQTEEQCTKGEIGYKELKELLLEAHLSYFAKARATYEQLQSDESALETLLTQNNATLTTQLNETLTTLRGLFGMIPRKKEH